MSRSPPFKSLSWEKIPFISSPSACLSRSLASVWRKEETYRILLFLLLPKHIPEPFGERALILLNMPCCAELPCLRHHSGPTVWAGFPPCLKNDPTHDAGDLLRRPNTHCVSLPSFEKGRISCSASFLACCAVFARCSSAFSSRIIPYKWAFFALPLPTHTGQPVFIPALE